jgi:translin
MIKMDLTEFLKEVEEIKRGLYEKYEAKEKIYLKIREAQRLCGEAISLIQQEMMEEAKTKLTSAEKMIEGELRKLEDKEVMEDLSEAYTTMLQEYVEAKALLEMEEGHGIPRASDLKVPVKAYILGLADLIGELKRRTITSLIKGDVESAKIRMDLMNKIFQALESLEYPRSLVPGLRKKLDEMRKSIEDLERIMATSIISMKLYEALRNIYGQKYLKAS